MLLYSSIFCPQPQNKVPQNQTNGNNGNKNNDKPELKTMICYKCHKPRRTANKCPQNKSTPSSHFIKGVEDDNEAQLHNMVTHEIDDSINDDQVQQGNMDDQDNLGNSTSQLHSLLRMQVKIGDDSYALLNCNVSTHYFISTLVARKLKLNMFPNNYKLKVVFQGTKFNYVHIVKGLQYQLGDFMETRDFLVTPLQNTDLILGMHWRYHFNPDINYDKHTFTIKHEGKNHILQGDQKLEIEPLLSHAQTKRLARKDNKQLVNEIETRESKLTPSPEQFFIKYNEIFVEDLPPRLPPSRLEDHILETYF